MRGLQLATMEATAGVRGPAQPEPGPGEVIVRIGARDSAIRTCTCCMTSTLECFRSSLRSSSVTRTRDGYMTRASGSTGSSPVSQ